MATDNEADKPGPYGSVLQTWVTKLGRRHQGVLLAICRGYDDVPKEDISKLLTRNFRSQILVPFVENPSSYIQPIALPDLVKAMEQFIKSMDHYAIHFILHLTHAAEIVGYKHPDVLVRCTWRKFYEAVVHAMHLKPENEACLDFRLLANEADFKANAEVIVTVVIIKNLADYQGL